MLDTMPRLPLLISLAGLFFMLAACQPSPDTFLLRQQGQWELRRGLYETYVAEDLIAGRDTVNQGTLSFFATGNGTWILPDSSLIDLTWDYANDIERMEIRLDQQIFAGESGFSFRVVENSNQRQIWQSEKKDQVWNALRQDSSERRILVRWQLERE